MDTIKLKTENAIFYSKITNFRKNVLFLPHPIFNRDKVLISYKTWIVISFTKIVQVLFKVKILNISLIKLKIYVQKKFLILFLFPRNEIKQKREKIGTRKRK